jgi:signal transduction histidine kinase
LAKGVPTVPDEVLDLPAGRRHWQTSLVPVRDSETSRIVALVGIRRDMTDIARTQQDVRDIATRLLSLQDEERRRIALELHDTTGQHMIAVGLALMLIEDAAGDWRGLRDAVARMRVSLAEAQTEIRTLS